MQVTGRGVRLHPDRADDDPAHFRLKASLYLRAYLRAKCMFLYIGDSSQRGKVQCMTDGTLEALHSQ